MSWPTSLFDSSAVRFLIVGAVNTMIGLVVIFAAKWLLGMGDITANLIGYGAGLVVSFRMHTLYTFRYSGPQFIVLVKYVVVLFASYLMNLGCVLTAIHALQINSYLAQAIGVVPYTFCMYLCSRSLVFVHPKKLAKQQPQE